MNYLRTQEEMFTRKFFHKHFPPLSKGLKKPHLLTERQIEPPSAVVEFLTIRHPAELRGKNTQISNLHECSETIQRAIGTQKNELFKAALIESQLVVVQSLLRDPEVDPTYDRQFAIRFAATTCNWDLITILMEDPRVDPSYSIGEMLSAFQNSVRCAHIELMKAFLQDPRVDPAAHGNWALQYAASAGRAEIVEILMEQPTVRNDFNSLMKAYKKAVQLKHSTVQKVLRREVFLNFVLEEEKLKNMWVERKKKAESILHQINNRKRLWMQNKELTEKIQNHNLLDPLSITTAWRRDHNSV